MTAVNNLQPSKLRTCFDRLSMTALKNFKPLKLKNNVSLSLSKAVKFNRLSMTFDRLSMTALEQALQQVATLAITGSRPHV